MNLVEIRAKLVSSIAVCLDVYSQNKYLDSTRVCWEQVQLAAYWLTEASNLLQEEMNGIVTGEAEPVNWITPTMITTDERLQFLKEQLYNLSKEIWTSSEEGMPPEVRHKVLQAHNKVNEAKFLNDISINYYGQYKQIREQQYRLRSTGGNTGGGFDSRTDTEASNQSL